MVAAHSLKRQASGSMPIPFTHNFFNELRYHLFPLSNAFLKIFHSLKLAACSL
jgi:hypothetical protein